MAPKTNPGAKVRQEGTSEDLERTSVREQQESKAGPQTAPPIRSQTVHPHPSGRATATPFPKDHYPGAPRGGCRSQGASKRENWEALKIETWGSVVQWLRTRCSLNPNFFICHHNRGKVVLNLCPSISSSVKQRWLYHLLIWIKWDLNSWDASHIINEC